MTRRNQGVAVGILAVCFSALVGVACGDDGGSEENVGASGGSAGTDGLAGSSSGGTSNNNAGTGGSAGTDAGGAPNGGTGGTANGGTGGTSSVASGNPDDVIGAACDWEFRCCDAGERKYRLSPFATDAASCATRLIFEMRESNATNNPYVSGPAAAGGILGTLGYVVNLSRVEVNAAGVQECKDYWDSLGCNAEADPNARCAGPAGEDPCALTNLFNPILQIGDECTIELAENGIYNDVECVAGSTCLPAFDADNPNDFPTCVKRNVESEPCTEDADCDFNFFCSSAGSCTEKSDVDEACSFNDPAAPAPGDEDIQCKAGLSCNPNSLKCVASCTLGSICAVDESCPVNSGCAPIEVGSGDTSSFRACTTLGNTAAALCNTDNDCEPTRYCDGTVCQSDKTISANCGAQNECGTGLHCDTLAATPVCTTNVAANNACIADFQCGPNSAGCLDQGTDGINCKNSKLAIGAPCGNNTACASDRCELATTGAAGTTCVAGAGVGADCDSVPLDGDAQSCAPGLLCFGDTGAVSSGRCATQATAGVSCKNPDNNVDDAMCANGFACDNQWELDICTDFAVPEANGGTDLTCDGNGGT